MTADTMLPAGETIGGGVQVKPLEWREQPSAGKWHADRYTIRIDQGEPNFYIVSGWEAGTNPYDTLEAAKAAAQRNFEVRILSALASPPPGEPVQGVTEARADEIVTSLYRRFKDWSKRGFGPDDVTWCEVKAEIIALIALAQPEAPASLAKEGVSVTEALVKDAATEYLSHRGERPYRILRGGQELWETHAPAIRAALTAALARGSASLAEDTMQPDKYDGGNFNGLVQGEDNDPEASHG